MTLSALLVIWTETRWTIPGLTVSRTRFHGAYLARVVKCPT